MSSPRLTILHRLKKELEAAMQEAEERLHHDPRMLLVQLRHKEFPALLKEFPAGKRLGPEFSGRLESLANRERKLEREVEGFDFVKIHEAAIADLVRIRSELQQVNTDIYFATARPA